MVGVFASIGDMEAYGPGRHAYPYGLSVFCTENRVLVRRYGSPEFSTESPVLLLIN